MLCAAPVKSIVLTYPGYRTLPKGIKKMLVLSETVFFRQTGKAPSAHGEGGLATGAVRREEADPLSGGAVRAFSSPWRN